MIKLNINNSFEIGHQWNQQNVAIKNRAVQGIRPIRAGHSTSQDGAFEGRTSMSMTIVLYDFTIIAFIYLLTYGTNCWWSNWSHCFCLKQVVDIIVSVTVMRASIFDIYILVFEYLMYACLSICYKPGTFRSPNLFCNIYAKNAQKIKPNI